MTSLDPNWCWALGASVMVSSIAFVGIFTLTLGDRILNRILLFLTSFAAGALIGGAFLHLIPKALHHGSDEHIFIFVLLGFILFFIMERYLHWRHCHEDQCEVHPFTYLNLIGDGVHNFTDGLIIGASFFININLGIAATTAIILHEIPQEMGDFAVLVYGGFSKRKALYYNFLSAITAIFGTVIGYQFSGYLSGFSGFLLAFAAGGFIYIASCDLIPELHKQKDIRAATWAAVIFLSGIFLMYATKLGHSHS
jgi:zinc and cadmium transporter